MGRKNSMDIPSDKQAKSHLNMTKKEKPLERN